MPKKSHEKKFTLKRKLKRVEVPETRLKIVKYERDQDGNKIPVVKKVTRIIQKDVDMGSVTEAIVEAQEKAVKQGFADVSLEKVTDSEYKFRFYNLIDFPRTEKEKIDAKKQK